jgi:arginyl-tRNA synthetase
MTSLLAELSAIAGAAFAAEGISPELGHVQVSDRPDLAEFQCNGALAAAKLAKTNPRAIAEKITARLRESPLIGEAVIAGPGFINLKLAPASLEKRLQSLHAHPDRALPASGTGKRAIVDFGGPNIAKPMHVGHLRSSIIGDCLQRLFRLNGWSVVSDVHLGDWGGRTFRISIRPTGVPIPKNRRSRWTIWRSFIRWPRPPAKLIRSGSKPRARRRRSFRRGGRATARCGSISTTCPRSD